LNRCTTTETWYYRKSVRVASLRGNSFSAARRCESLSRLFCRSRDSDAFNVASSSLAKLWPPATPTYAMPQSQLNHTLLAPVPFSQLSAAVVRHKANDRVKVKVKVVNLYSASSCIHTSNALFVTNQSRRSHSRHVQPANTGWRTGRPVFVTNQSRRSHSRHVQPANTGWRTGRPGSPVSCTKVSTFRNPYNELLLI